MNEHPLARKFEKHLRQAARTKQASGSHGSQSPSAALSPSVRPSSDDSMRINLGDETASQPRISRPSSAGAVPGRRNRKEIGDIDKLSLEQQQDTPMRDVPDAAPAESYSLSPITLRKRAAGGDLTSAESPQDTNASGTATNPRRAKARSGGPFVRSRQSVLDPEFDRSAPVSGEGDLSRPVPSQKRTLFDPSSDNPKDAFLTNSMALPARHQRFADSRSQTLRSRKETPKRRGGMPGSLSQRPSGPAKVASADTAISSDQLPLDDPAAREQQTIHPTGLPVKASQSERQANTELVLQPETRPISQEQLVNEVRGIYATLGMIETKCIEVDNKQAMALMDPENGEQPKLSNEQFQALIALHRTLLHEHHDFFLASQHPSASPALRRLASKYAMPARMWRHGIHSFLELLRHRLPDSLDHMLAFIYLAYSMMALLYETVPTFEDTWIECLGDLGRYRMAIEDDDLRDRETWTGVARFWYSKAADKSPSIGRLYHHLAILARPDALQQLFYYAKSLSVVHPFMSARESILTLFEPILSSSQAQNYLSAIDTAFVRAHGLLFTDKDLARFSAVQAEFLQLLDTHIGKEVGNWREQGVYIAVANFAAMLGFGSEDGILLRTLRAGNVQAGDPTEHASQQMQKVSSEDPPGNQRSKQSSPAGEHASSEPVPPGETTPEAVSEMSAPLINFNNSKRLTFSTFDIALQRFGDPNVLPHIHVSLVFIHYLRSVDEAMKLIEYDVPWASMCSMLNTLAPSYQEWARLESTRFPEPEKGVGRPLPEDFSIRGLGWAQNYFPEAWFSDAMIEDDERSFELPSMKEVRKERILWLAYQISQTDRYLHFDPESRTFSISPSLKLKTRPENDSQEAEKSAATTNEGAPPIKDIEVELQILEDESGVIEFSPQESPKHPRYADQRGSSPPSRASRIVSAAAQSLDPSFTAMVCDTNLFIDRLEVFEVMARGAGWRVVVPHAVMTELRDLSDNEAAIGQAAEKALHAIESAIHEGKDITIVSSSGTNLTPGSTFKEQQIHHYPSEDHKKSLDEVIISTTKQQELIGEERLRQSASNRLDSQADNIGSTKMAVLVTEDRAMRLKASEYNVTAIAPLVVRGILEPLLPKRESVVGQHQGPD
ncbi:MAG: hypothetical protein M1819_003993 [Sarea resinae]|nr:MAG: hypothetical protein M1819_003993 [Sarea resinae]